MMKMDTVKNKIRQNPLFCFSVVCIWLFYLWIIRETPYAIDDWSWGLPVGWRELVTGELNGRYLSNLLEVVVTRSPLLKTLLIGTLAMLLPLLSTHLCLRFAEAGSSDDPRPDSAELELPLFLLAALLFLSIPIPVWRQTYGWIAGFSNFGFAGIVLLVYQGILLRALRTKDPVSKAFLVAVFLFGIVMQLVLENVTIYSLAVTAFFTLEEVLRKRKVNPILFIMLLGNLIGAFIMFSGSIYGTLMETGQAVNGMRSMKINHDIGLWANLLVFQERFVFFFPQNIWSNNWVLSAAVSLLLASSCLKKKRPIQIALSVVFFLFAVLFCCMRLIGPLERFVPGWSDVLTQRLNLLYFWLVAGTVSLLWRDRKSMLAVLLFLWFSAPGVILPLTATNMKADATRCFLTSAVFQVEFCLLLFSDGWVRNHKRSIVSVLLAAGILVCCAHKLVIYHDIDTIRRERAELVKSAQRGETDRLDFPDFPHLEYLWSTEPVGDKQKGYFRDFYRIPDGVEMHFNTGEEDE